MHDVDYERYGRQIALPELGVQGQRALASRAVRFLGHRDGVALAEQLWSHAGGALATATARDALDVELPSSSSQPEALLAAAAWATLTAARALLSWSPCDLPPDLRALLEHPPLALNDRRDP